MTTTLPKALTTFKARREPGDPSGKFKPTPPRVDVLPAQWRAKRAARTARTRAICGCLSAALVVGGVYGYGVLRAHQLDEATIEAQALSNRLSKELAVYAPVTNLAIQTDQLTATVQQQTSTDIDYSQVVQRFLAAVDGTLAVSTLQIGSGVDCASTDVFVTVPTAGCITFTGTTGEGGAAAMISALSRDSWFVNAYVPNIDMRNSSTGTLNGSVALSLDAYVTPITPDPSESESK